MVTEAMFSLYSYAQGGKVYFTLYQSQKAESRILPKWNCEATKQLMESNPCCEI